MILDDSDIQWIVVASMTCRTGEYASCYGYRDNILVCKRIIWIPLDPPPIPMIIKEAA